MKMKKQLDIKKLLLLNMPYILMGLFATNFGEGWRMAVGADASAKMLSFFSTLPVALASWWPSLHPLDLLVGLCCGAGKRQQRSYQDQVPDFRHRRRQPQTPCIPASNEFEGNIQAVVLLRFHSKCRGVHRVVLPFVVYGGHFLQSAISRIVH